MEILNKIRELYIKHVELPKRQVQQRIRELEQDYVITTGRFHIDIRVAIILLILDGAAIICGLYVLDIFEPVFPFVLLMFWGVAVLAYDSEQPKLRQCKTCQDNIEVITLGGFEYWLCESCKTGLKYDRGE
ncbi:MAG: hypothetical protein V4658_12985 [Bacteroidota bacterium]